MDNSSTSVDQNRKNGFVTVFKIVKIGLKLLFPSYILIQMNHNLGRAYRFYKNDWFPQQIKRNWLITIVLSSLFLSPIGFGLMAIKGNREFQSRFDSAKKGMKIWEISKNAQHFSYAFKEKKLDFEVKFFGSFAIFGLLLGNFIVLNHSLVKDSKKLIKLCKNEGIINKDNANPTVLYTPIGVLMDISGSAPKEISSNERIWLAMNIQIKDWAEDPDKRSLVFFKTAFKLKSRYDYFLSEMK